MSILFLAVAISLVLITIPSSSSSSSTSPNPIVSHPNFQHLIVKQQTNNHHNNYSSQSYDQLFQTTTTQKWRLDLVHRDAMHTDISHNHHNHNHHKKKKKKKKMELSLFLERMKRDGVRVESVVRRASSESGSGSEGFGSEVMSGMEQGSGEYFVRIGVGSPARTQYVVVDSGSDIVWVQCRPCRQCYAQSDPLFDPAGSASFAGVSCSSALCGRLDSPAGCRAGRCRYEVSYGDGSFTRGTLALETLTLGHAVVKNVAIGCGHTNQGMFVGAAGLLGLGAGSMSFVGQLNSQTGGAFTYCLATRGSDAPGSLEFGRGALPVGAAWVPLVRNPRATSFYYIGLVGLGVGGGRVSGVPEDTFRLAGESGEGGVVMDTGTAVTRFPTQAYTAFRDAFLEQTAGLPRAPGVSIFDTCYDLSEFVSVRVPTVSFYLEGGPILTLPARNFLIPVDDLGTFCFAFSPSPSGLSIIGNIQQQGIQISLDGANGFVGFGPNVC